TFIIIYFYPTATSFFFFFFFIAPSTSYIYTLSLHDALPILFIDAFLILVCGGISDPPQRITFSAATASASRKIEPMLYVSNTLRSEEHTSELQSLAYLVCRLLLEKKKHKQKLIF